MNFLKHHSPALLVLFLFFEKLLFSQSTLWDWNRTICEEINSPPVKKEHDAAFALLKGGWTLVKEETDDHLPPSYPDQTTDIAFYNDSIFYLFDIDGEVEKQYPILLLHDTLITIWKCPLSYHVQFVQRSADTLVLTNYFGGGSFNFSKEYYVRKNIPYAEIQKNRIQPIPVKSTNSIHPSKLYGYWLHTGVMIDTAECSPELRRSFEQEKMIMEEYNSNWPPTENIFFDPDSIAWMDYPCQIYQKASYTFSGDSVYFFNLQKHGQRVVMNGIHMKLISQGCITNTYKNKLVKPDTIQVLQDLYTNPVCALGIYKLKTHFMPEYPAYDREHVSVPPVNVQQKIDLTDYISMYDLLKTGIIYLKVNNTMKMFYLSYSDFCNYDQNCVYRLVLVPAEWWTGEAFELEYRFSK